VTTPADDEETDEASKQGLEKRARDSRARLLETIDALERRGARLVETARGLRHVGALAVDAVAVLGALMSILSMLKASDRRVEIPSARRGAGGMLGRLAIFAVFAGVAYIARPRRGAAPTSAATGIPRSRLRAIP
jgi:hypothetical protein